MQVWSSPGGDAIVLVPGHFGSVTIYVVFRPGDRVHVVAEVGLTDAMKAFGIDPDGFETVSAENYEEAPTSAQVA